MSFLTPMVQALTRRAAPTARMSMWDDLFSPVSSSGKTVTTENALRNMAVWACIRTISQSLASVPLLLYQRDGRSRRRAVEHPLYRVLQQTGNREMTAYEVREARVAHTMATGNAYAEIQYDDNYNVVGLWPLPPDAVGIERTESGRLQYTIWDGAQGYVLPGWRVMHTRYLIWRGVFGMSPIRQAMNAVGLGLAAEEFGGKYFSNGARPSIILKHPGRMTPEAYDRLRNSFAQRWQGLENAHRINILEEGITPESIGIPPDEAQFLQTREFQVAEIARLYGVPLHMLAASQTATYASAEMEAINFRQFTLLEWAKRDEQRLMQDLLSERERNAGYYVEYLLDGLERSTIDSRMAAEATMIQNGISTPNEARIRNNMEPLPGGDVLLLPLNMQHIGPDGTDQTPDLPDAAAEEPAPTPARRSGEIADCGLRIADCGVLDPLVWDVRRRVAARVANDVRLAGGKALRRGGRVALSEWGEGEIIGWRTAGDEMLQPVRQAAERLGVDCGVQVAQWVEEAYLAAVDELIGGGDGTAVG